MHSRERGKNGKVKGSGQASPSFQDLDGGRDRESPLLEAHHCSVLLPKVRVSPLWSQAWFGEGPGSEIRTSEF